MDYEATVPAQLKDLSVNLAYAIASDLYDTATIEAQFKLEPGTIARLMKTRDFADMVRSQQEQWNAVTNSAERVRLKAMMCVEESLLELYKIATGSDEKIGASNKIAAIKELREMAGMSSRAGVNDDGSREAAGGVQVTIAFNGSPQTYTAVASVKTSKPEPEEPENRGLVIDYNDITDMFEDA